MKNPLLNRLVGIVSRMPLGKGWAGDYNVKDLITLLRGVQASS
jgi:hypothetical protein